MTAPDDNDGRGIALPGNESTPVLATTSMEDEATSTPGALQLLLVSMERTDDLSRSKTLRHGPNGSDV